MSTQSRQHGQKSIALRAILSGLLASPLSDSELKRFAQDLDLEFLSNLREMLLSLPLSNNESDLGEDLHAPLDFEDSLVGMILDRAKGRRLSKSTIYNYMREIDPMLAKTVIRPADTLRNSIELFVQNSGVENGNRLLSRVLGTLEQDPYLSGISKRK